MGLPGAREERSGGAKSKELPSEGIIYVLIGGGGGNRTRVRKQINDSLYVCSLPFESHAQAPR